MKFEVFSYLLIGAFVQQMNCHFLPSMEDFVITVKTTKRFHDNRMLRIYNSWYNHAPRNIFFVTDNADEKWRNRLGNQIIPTNCSRGHSNEALCCKMDIELQLFASKSARFYCHFDDDNDVRIKKLRSFLGDHDSRELLYFGKVSTEKPVEYKMKSFRFATGGAGICISNKLMRRVKEYMDNVQSFENICKETSFPDDVTLGYLIEIVLNVPLQNTKKFHSHLAYDRYFDNDGEAISLGVL